MFSEELALDEYPSFFEQAEKLLEDLLKDDASLLQNATTKGTMKKHGSGAAGAEKNEDTMVSDESKKIMHRETERQRRRKMSGLYDSLRSLLPPQDIKGKRTVCDHMQEAVNYIKHLETSIKELEIRGEKLKKLATNSSSGTKSCSDAGDGALSTSNSSVKVKVNRCDDEMLEILISCSNDASDGFPMSRVLVELLGRGLDPLTLDSTRTNQKSLHKIQTRASDHVMASIDLAALQDRLTDIIKR